MNKHFYYFIIIIIIIILRCFLDSYFSTILFRTQGECTKGVYFNILILEYVNCYYIYMNKHFFFFKLLLLLLISNSSRCHSWSYIGAEQQQVAKRNQLTLLFLRLSQALIELFSFAHDRRVA